MKIIKQIKYFIKKRFFYMEEIKHSDDVLEQIKDFDHENLTEKQELLIDKLILNEELKIFYKKFGLYKKCKKTKNNVKYQISVNNFNMKEIKLSDDVFEQIKDFDHENLTEKQELLIDKLI